MTDAGEIWSSYKSFMMAELELELRTKIWAKNWRALASTQILPPEEELAEKFQQHVSEIRKDPFLVDCMVAKPMTKKEIRYDKTGKAQAAIKKEGQTCRPKAYGMILRYEIGMR